LEGRYADSNIGSRAWDDRVNVTLGRRGLDDPRAWTYPHAFRIDVQ